MGKLVQLLWPVEKWAPKDVHILTLRTYVRIHGKREIKVADRIIIKAANQLILRWGE